MEVTIKASDGKLFHGLTEVYGEMLNNVKTYEAELKAKREKEEAARKEKEEKQKKIELLRETKLKEINDIFNKATSMVYEYEKETGNKLIYTRDYCSGDMTVKEVKNTINYAWDDVIVDILKPFILDKKLI